MTRQLTRRELLATGTSTAVAGAPLLAGCLGGGGGTANNENGSNSSTESGTSDSSNTGGVGASESNAAGEQNTGASTASAATGGATIQNVTFTDGSLRVDLTENTSAAGINVIEPNGTSAASKPVPTGASRVTFESYETVNANVTIVAVNRDGDQLDSVTREFGPQISLSRLRQPALDDPSSGIPGAQDRTGGENPYTTLVVDVENTGNVSFTASGISVVSGVPQPGSASQFGSAFTVQPGETKTVQADDAGNSVIAAWGGSWGAEGAPNGSCQGETKEARVVIFSNNGNQISKTFKLVYRGGLYTMNEMQNFETCGRIHSLDYSPERDPLTPDETSSE